MQNQAEKSSRIPKVPQQFGTFWGKHLKSSRMAGKFPKMSSKQLPSARGDLSHPSWHRRQTQNPGMLWVGRKLKSQPIPPFPWAGKIPSAPGCPRVLQPGLGHSLGSSPGDPELPLTPSPRKGQRLQHCLPGKFPLGSRNSHLSLPIPTRTHHPKPLHPSQPTAPRQEWPSCVKYFITFGYKPHPQKMKAWPQILQQNFLGITQGWCAQHLGYLGE